MHVRAAPPEHYPWIVQRAGVAVSKGFRGIEAIDERTGEIKAMLGFDGWTPNSVMLSIALDEPVALRRLILAGFSYAFCECDREVMLGVIRSSNMRSLTLARRFGFKVLSRVRDGWLPGDDLFVIEMRRDECRWLKRKAA